MKLTISSKESNPESEKCKLNYCENSSLHGIKYTTKNHSKTLCERALWLAILMISGFFTGYFILSIYDKRCKSPVIVSLNENPIPIWDIPFPAITVCPETKTYAEKFQYSETRMKFENDEPLEKFSEKELEYFNVIHQVCIGGHFFKNLTSNYEKLNYAEVLQTLAPTIKDSFGHCYFSEDRLSCNKSFFPIITEVGLCFTFNSLSGEEIYRTSELASDFFLPKSERKIANWSIDEGYLNNDLEPYPRSGFFAGIKSGYWGVLSLFNKDFDYLCRGLTQGFQVILHNPADQPQLLEEHHKVQLGSETTLKIDPRMIVTSSALQFTPPRKRGCFFSHERYLKFFRIYTKSNCYTECLTNHTLYKCGCVKFHMPRNQTTRICSANDIDCYENAEYNLMEIQHNEEDGDENKKCNCLPLCRSIEYDVGVTDVNFNWREYVKAIKEEATNGTEAARFNVYFKRSEIISYKRSELFSNTDFLAQIGGIIGMFLGASLLSIVEVLYFIIRRSIDCCCKTPADDNDGIIFVTPSAKNA